MQNDDQTSFPGTVDLQNGCNPAGRKARSWHAGSPRNRGIVVMVVFATLMSSPSELVRVPKSLDAVD